MAAEIPRNHELEFAAFVSEDSESRRVYADWLESVGDPRSEHIALELERRDAYLSERHRFEARLRELEREWELRWQQRKQELDLLEVEHRLRCGFLVRLAGPLGQLRPQLDALFADEPIQNLELRECDREQLIDLLSADNAWLSRLRRLKLSGEVGEVGCQLLAEREWPRLRRLNLRGAEIDGAACDHLATLDTRQLEGLTLTFNAVDDGGLERLLSSPTRGQWRHLYLSSNPITAAGLRALANTSGLEALEGLYLREIEARFADFEVVLDSPTLPGLVRLEPTKRGIWRERELASRMRERFGAYAAI